MRSIYSPAFMKPEPVRPEGKREERFLIHIPNRHPLRQDAYLADAKPQTIGCYLRLPQGGEYEVARLIFSSDSGESVGFWYDSRNWDYKGQELAFDPFIYGVFV
jgi:hypothetical protein